MNTSPPNHYVKAKHLYLVALFHKPRGNYTAYSYLVDHYDAYFMQELLRVQPELANIYEEFKDSLSKDPKNHKENFSKIFADKIKIHSIAHTLFETSSNYKGNKYNVKTLNDILKAYPDFLDLTHAYIHSDESDTNLVLYEFYFNAINKRKDLYVDTAKILKKIDDIRVLGWCTNAMHYKIELYTLLPEKNGFLYDHIRKKMDQYLTKDVSLLKQFESKIALFDAQTIKKYTDNKIQFKRFFDKKEDFIYSFKLGQHYIRYETNFDSFPASFIARSFERALINIVEKHYEVEKVENNDYRFSYLFKCEEDLNKFKKFCHFISDNLSLFMNKEIQDTLSAKDLTYLLNNPNNHIDNKINEDMHQLYIPYVLQEELKASLPINEPKKNNRRKI